jgi:hypothetical protein
VHAGLPQLGFLTDDTTAAHAAGLWRRYDARKDSFFDASPEPTAEDERSKYNRGRDEQQQEQRREEREPVCVVYSDVERRAKKRHEPPRARRTREEVKEVKEEVSKMTVWF